MTGVGIGPFACKHHASGRGGMAIGFIRGPHAPYFDRVGHIPLVLDVGVLVGSAGDTPDLMIEQPIDPRARTGRIGLRANRQKHQIDRTEP